MQTRKIYFDETDKNAYLEVFSDGKKTAPRKAILIIPGGGYRRVAADREGGPVAEAFLAYDFVAFVLNYTVFEKPFPSHLIQASKAMKYIKDNKEEYGIDTENVFVVGFSAGGHLAGSLGTMWDKKEIYDEIDMPFGYNKPKGMMLIYPVVSSKYKFHKPSFDSLLLDEDAPREKRKACSLEENVSKNTPPAFIMHTSNDELVDVRNSLTLGAALKKHNILFEMHIYPDAPHGIALATEVTMRDEEKFNNPHIAEWVKNAVYWAEHL